jgi:hypothetical protein
MDRERFDAWCDQHAHMVKMDSLGPGRRSEQARSNPTMPRAVQHLKQQEPWQCESCGEPCAETRIWRRATTGWILRCAGCRRRHAGGVK